MHHVIIGGGAAGRAAIAQIRKLEPKSEITLVSAEADPFYFRPYLGAYLLNKKLPEAQPLADAEFRALAGVNFALGAKVISVAPKQNALELSNGKQITYSTLLIATGTRFWTQELAPEGAQTYTLKTRSDALRLQRASAAAKSALVYGGGYQALELTRIFHQQGKKVRWMAPPGSFWKHELPDATALQVNEKLKSLGLDLAINRRITHALDLDGQHYHITDDFGEVFECELIALAPHEVPCVDFLAGSGIQIDQGVLVNEELRTNIPNVFAAGDCAQVYDLNSGKSRVNFGWKSASRQGVVAGENMAGLSSVIIPTKSEFTLDLLGKKLLERW